MTDPKKSAGKAPSANYEVGYCKPPLHTRFQPGRSGNPRGRPKGTKNLKTDLMEELGEKILVHEGERSYRISKQRAVMKTLVKGTLKGDPRVASLLTSLMMRLLDTGEGAPEAAEPLHDDEQEILQAFEDRIRRGETDEVSARVDHDDDPENEK